MQLYIYTKKYQSAVMQYKFTWKSTFLTKKFFEPQYQQQLVQHFIFSL